MANGEKKLLERWTLWVGLLSAIVVPTVTATGAYFKLDSKIQEREAIVTERISSLELQTTKSFAEKNDLKEIREDIKQLRNDVTEIKTMLQRRR
jgi:hypothetical protein